MAGDWIKMRSDLFTHPKVVRMASALKADTLRTVGGLMSVWCLFDAHSEDGHLDGYSPEVLDDHLRWAGFADAMMAVGWLEHDPGKGLDLPRFDTHNGQSAKRRAQDADRKRELRKTSASEADKMRTREEKRREENKEQQHSSEQSPDKPSKKHGTDEDHKAAHWIFDRVRLVVPTAKEPNWNGWANDIRLMREQDGRTHREICELFEWANGDSFWRANILSPDKLRTKWTALEAKRGNAPGRRTPPAENFSGYGKGVELL